ncbi:MAG TPA: terminase TerL endonuclease subunit [Candidatus Paceibacterota bacterium]|nr:terminase TerL endonuclease subunit [Candidatus Paceibacterota bacterium]
MSNKTQTKTSLPEPAWVSRVVAATKPKNPDTYYFDWEEAERRVEFIEKFCRYPEGPKAGKLMQLDQWQKEEIIYPAFGWKEKGTGLRRYRMVFLGIPRKNAKTTLTAAISLSILFQDGEDAAQLYCAAGETFQAGIIYKALSYMVEADTRLSKRAEVYRNELRYPEKRSFVKVLSADARSKHGFNAHAVMFDELHTQPNRDLWDVLTSSMLSRSQPITFVMTTAGTDTNSLCYEYWEYARNCAKGVIEDDRFLPLIYEASAEDDWHDPKVWKKANPGLGTILSEKNFRIEYDKACQMPSYINTFLNLHLNVWTQAAERWITDDAWMKCAMDFEPEDVAGLPCWCGLDLASTRDLNAFACLWVDEVNDRKYLKVYHFVNRSMAQNKKLTAGVDYIAFKNEGSLHITEGNTTDHRYIFEFITQFAKENDVQAMAYDRYMSGYIVSELNETGLRVEPFGQGYTSMSFPTKQFEVEILRGRIHHDGKKCMRWQMGNVVIERSPADDVKVTKKKSKPHQKVDGVVASIMALGQWIDDKGRSGSSVIPDVFGLDF